LGLLFFIEGLHVRDIRCGDGCVISPHPWHKNIDSWQWDAQFALTTVAAVAMIGGVFLWFQRGKTKSGPALSGLGVALFAVWVSEVAGRASNS